jgi:hypothetical protein
MLKRMDNVIWAALIAIGGSGVTGGIAAYASTTVARGQQNVELGKLGAERDRLAFQHAEQERSNRQGTYHRLLAVLDRFDIYATGWPPPEGLPYEALLEEFNLLLSGIYLFGDEQVTDALGPITDRLTRVGSAMAADMAEPDVWKRFAAAYRPLRAGVIEAQMKLTLAMRADINLADQGQ